jgi:hypothetical protein
MWCTIRQAFLAERMLVMNKEEAEGDQRLPGLAGELPGRKGGGPHAQDQIAKLLPNLPDQVDALTDRSQF